MRAFRTLADGPLRGASVVVTRPVGRCLPLERRIAALGGIPLRLPGSSVRPLAQADAVRTRLAEAMRGHILVFVSPTAVRFTWRAHPQFRPAARSLVFAVGPATARALRRRGIEPLVPLQGYDSEGLLRHPQLACVQGMGVRIFAAPGGRTLLADTLRARGAQVRVIMVYRRAAARWSRSQREALASAPAPRIWLLSSVQTLAHLEAGLATALWQRARNDWVVVASERVAHAARAYGCTRVRVARSALADDLLAAAAHAISH